MFIKTHFIINYTEWDWDAFLGTVKPQAVYEFIMTSILFGLQSDLK